MTFNLSCLLILLERVPAGVVTLTDTFLELKAITVLIYESRIYYSNVIYQFFNVVKTSDPNLSYILISSTLHQGLFNLELVKKTEIFYCLFYSFQFTAH